MPVSDGGNAAYTAEPWTIAATIWFCGAPLGEADLVGAVVPAPSGTPTERKKDVEYSLRKIEKFISWIILYVVSFFREEYSGRHEKQYWWIFLPIYPKKSFSN